jgi:hypothetical protein
MLTEEGLSATSAASIEMREHLIARAEGRHVAAHRHNRACDVVSQLQRCGVGNDRLELAQAEAFVQVVQSGGRDLNQDVLRPHLGFGHLDEAQWLLVCRGDEGAHR